MATNDKMPRYLRPNVKIQYPNSAERDYYRVLRAIVRELRKYTNELLPSIKPALKQDAESDDIISEVTARFNNSRVREAALNEVRRIMGSVDNIAKQNMNKAFKNCLGVDVFMRNSELLEKITNEWYASQSQLINSIVSTYTEKLGTIISNAVQRGSLYKDVYADVKHLYDITDNRAKFIARNEIGNLNAITTKTRQQEAGISCYEWLTSRDERVRASHAAMDGNLYYWHRSTPGEINGRKVYPTPNLQPGMDYNCRCVAIPIIDTENWNVANATPDSQPVANKATEVMSVADKETRDWKKYYSLKNKENSLNENIKDLEAKLKEAELKFITEISEKIIPLCKDKQLILAYNKTDMTHQPLRMPIDKLPPQTQEIDISAKYGTNIGKLKQMLVTSAGIPEISQGDTIITNVRHYEALTLAHDAINRVIQGLNNGLPSDLVSQDLRDCLHHLAEITGGEITSEETLQNIFKHFCIGK